MRDAADGPRGSLVFAAEDDCTVLELGTSHAGAQLHQVFVGVDDATLDYL
jgi:hypothetical protein